MKSANIPLPFRRSAALDRKPRLNDNARLDGGIVNGKISDYATTVDKALRYSLECARLFAFYGKRGCSDVYMILQVVADESYTATNGRHTVAIGGWLTTVELIEAFCRSW